MNRGIFALSAVAALLALATPARTEAQQSLTFRLGGFSPNGEDARLRDGSRSDDVLVNNLTFLDFNLEDFHGGTAGVEYLVGLGPWLDGGLGISGYSRSVQSVDARNEHANGAAIEQVLKLRIIPFTATVRLLPIGRDAVVRPYVGAGLGIFAWRYSETGEFVDTGALVPSDKGLIFRGSYVGSGVARGPVVFGGLAIPAGSWEVGGDVRYQRANGELPLDQQFSADAIDLGGWTYALTFGLRF